MWDEDDTDNTNDSSCDPERERKRVEALPVYQKAEEIQDLTRRIIDSITDERIRMIHTNSMLEDSIILPERIAAAEAVDDYVLKMENATIIKLHARSLQNQSASLVFNGMLPKEYLNLLQKELQAFKDLFKVWVQSFDKRERKDDGWGIFTGE